MKGHILSLSVLLIILVANALSLSAHTTVTGTLMKFLSSILKRTTASSSKTPQSDANVVQFDDGYVVDTVLEGIDIGVLPYKIWVSEGGELFAVDKVNSNIVKITPPLSRFSRSRLVAGSFQGYSGHVDGKPSDARFNHPKGVTLDDKGNVYVADALNFAIRKIGNAGVTTIAGGRSHVPGYRDGPGDGAKFSNDFDLVYVQSTCSLLIVDRGNAALRKVSLNQDDCDFQSSSITLTDALMIIGAVLVGYVACMLQHGLAVFFSRSDGYVEGEHEARPANEWPVAVGERQKEGTCWPSPRQLLADMVKLGSETLGSTLLHFIPWLRTFAHGKGLTPLRDSLILPEDNISPPPSILTQAVPAPEPKIRHSQTPNPTARYPETMPPKSKSTTRDQFLSSKCRATKHHMNPRPGEAADYTYALNRDKMRQQRSLPRDRSSHGFVGKMDEPKSDNCLKFDYYETRKCPSEKSYPF